MPTYSAGYADRPTWTLQLVASEGSLDAVANTSYVSWSLRLYRGTTQEPWNNSGTAWSVSGPGGASGTFPAYRFGSTGSGTNYSSVPVGGYVEIASGGASVAHDANGSKTVTFSASHAAGATLGTATIGSNNFVLTTLTQAPGVPSTVALAYTSDSAASLSWVDTSASNGQPVTNQIQTSVNGGTFTQVLSISAASSVVVSNAVNRKTVARVRATNTAGSSAYSASSNTVYTTPAAPTSVVAAKDAALDITVSWTPNVAFTEHEHVVEFSTNAGSSWSSLATVAGGTSTYKQVAPNPALIHVYRVRARNTDTGALTSAWVESNSVQLLAAPNAPTLAALPTNANKAADLVVTWTHNPVDTTPQTAYELEYSTNGGGSWTSSTKTTSTVSSYTIPASTHAANVTVTVRVRTWGQATTGGAETTGASDWSTTDAVTFKTIPVVTITAPADESVLDEAALNVVLGFSQAESATFVQATIVLTEGVTELESKVSTTLAGTLMDTEVEDDGSYSLSVTVLDSNGLTSAAVVSDFTVDFTPPATAGVVLTYDRDSGSTQIAVTIPAAGVGEVEAEFVTISRVIDGVRETLFTEYPVTVGAITFLDTTPTINGSNQYRVRTISGDGATADATVSLTTTETLWAFLSTGAGYGNYVSFGGDLTLSAKPARASALIPTAGRREPIALFGENTSRAVSGSTTLAADLGSTPAEVEAFMLEAGLVCYRDPSGRRVFGRLSGTVDTPSDLTSAFKFTVDEAS